MSDELETNPDDMPEDESDESSPPADPSAADEVFAEEPQARPELPPHPERDLTDVPGTTPANNEEIETVQEPSRFKAAMRRILTWFLVIAVFFLGGFLTYYFVLHKPVAEDLEAAQAEVTSLSSEVESLTGQLAAMEDASSHRSLLLVLVDVYDARVALSQENVVAAKSALADTSSALDEVFDDIEAFDSDLASALQPRLDLILSNLDRDIETAIADCDQLIEDLLEVEAALFR